MVYSHYNTIQTLISNNLGLTSEFLKLKMVDCFNQFLITDRIAVKVGNKKQNSMNSKTDHSLQFLKCFLVITSLSRSPILKKKWLLVIIHSTQIHKYYRYTYKLLLDTLLITVSAPSLLFYWGGVNFQSESFHPITLFLFFIIRQQDALCIMYGLLVFWEGENEKVFM